ncbi:MAG: RDD family protein [Planctomycetes bacterium]|nr:RDD family protein [Planctomycetota bacterium]
MSLIARGGIALLAVAIAMGAATEKNFTTIAASSGTHLWWIFKGDAQFELLHHAGVAPPDHYRIAAAFVERPVAIAADGDKVWVAFASTSGRMEVVSGGTHFNPASELWFTTPNGSLQLCPSIAGESLESLAAFDGEPWAIVSGERGARCLRGGAWSEVELPGALQTGSQRRLASTGGALNVLGRDSSGALLRFKRERDRWIESALDAPGFLYAVDHSARFACVASAKPSEESLFWVEAGTLAPIAPGPAFNRQVLGLGEGFAAVGEFVQGALHESPITPELQLLPSGASLFSMPIQIQLQESTASRWFYLPIIGVLSFAALIAAFMVRSLSAPDLTGEDILENPEIAEWSPLEKGRRLLATAIDLLPCAIAALVILDAKFTAILVPQFWSADIQLSTPYLVMVAAAVLFSTMEEIAFGCSMGKRLVGGRVVALGGGPAAWWQHLVRNLLKGLVLLAPVLAIPSLFSPHGIGIPEILSRTAVAEGERDAE